MSRVPGTELDFFEDYENAHTSGSDELETLADPSEWFFGTSSASGSPAHGRNSPPPKLDEGWRDFVGKLLLDEDDPFDEKDLPADDAVVDPPAESLCDGYETDSKDEVPALERMDEGFQSTDTAPSERLVRETALCVFDDGLGTGRRRWSICSSANVRTVSAPRATDARLTHTNLAEAICHVEICFLDGSLLKVEALKGDVATTILATALASVGLGAEHVASFGLYQIDDSTAQSTWFSSSSKKQELMMLRLERRVAPSTLAVALAATGKRLAIAVRLFTTPLRISAMRGFGQDSNASERALARLLYAQAASWLMSGAARLTEGPLTDGVYKSEVLGDDKSSTVTGIDLARRLGGLRLWSRAADLLLLLKQQQRRQNSPALAGITPVKRRSTVPDTISCDSPTSSIASPTNQQQEAPRTPGNDDDDSSTASSTWTTPSPSSLRGIVSPRSSTQKQQKMNSNTEAALLRTASRLLEETGVPAFVPEDLVRRSNMTLAEWSAALLAELARLLLAAGKEEERLIIASNALTSQRLQEAQAAANKSSAELGFMDSIWGTTAALPQDSTAERPKAKTPPPKAKNGAVKGGRPRASAYYAAAIPEAAYLELVSQLPLYGTTLFGCSSATREPVKSSSCSASPAAGDNYRHLSSSSNMAHVLAVGSRGVAIVAADKDGSSSDVVEVGISRLRRWRSMTEDGRGLYFESENPHDLWPEAARKRRTTPYSKKQERPTVDTEEHDRTEDFSPPPKATRLSSPRHAVESSDVGDFEEPASGASSPTSPRRPSSSIMSDNIEKTEPEEEVDVEAPMQRMAFILDFMDDDPRAKRETTLAECSEALSLLDDYSLFDLAYNRPRCEYEARRSADAQIAVKPPAPHVVAPPSVHTNSESVTSAAITAHEQSPITTPPPPASSKRRPTSPAPPPPPPPNDPATRPRPIPLASMNNINAEADGAYDALVGAVVRPPRFIYDVRLLGPSSFAFGGLRYARRDVVLENSDGLRIHCSHWTLAHKGPFGGKEAARPAVIFMHANSASRVQACNYLSVVLSLGCSLFAFDCSGSGLSDGAQVSLGWREAHDLHMVVDYLRSDQSKERVSSIAVWGHSMGAAAVVYYHALLNAPPLDACVLDSPYSDFSELAGHLVREHSLIFAGSLGKYVSSLGVSQMALTLALDYVDKEVERVGGFSPVRDLVPTRHATMCSAPALFMRARGDKIVTLAHIEAVANAYAGPRKLALVDGTHSSSRNGAARRFIGLFLAKNMRLSTERLQQPDPRTRDRHIEAVPWQRVRHSLPATTIRGAETTPSSTSAAAAAS